MSDAQLKILGPLEVRAADGTQLALPGARVRTLLARLAIEHPRPVSAGALVAAVWGGAPPVEEANALQSLVSRLRRGLGSAASIVSSAAGYAVHGVRVDAAAFGAAAASGARALGQGEAAQAEQQLGAALALWRGAALADIGDDPVLRAHAARLDDARLAATADHLDARLQLAGTDPDSGAGGALVAELEALADTHPLNERVAGLLLRALAADRRPAEAVARYQVIRNRLVEQLGTDPSAELAALHVRLLRGELDPPARSTRRRGNVRAQLTSFVGRDEDVARIADALTVHRLVTLIGPGGAGKTRLANQVVASLPASAAPVVWFVELAPLTSGADIAATVLNVLGAGEPALLTRRGSDVDTDAVGRLVQVLDSDQVIVVLDNCEHLVADCASLVDELLARCPHLQVVATSREPLNILGEALITVPPLQSPAPGLEPGAVLTYPAVRLFADRAVAAQAEFRIDEFTAGAVVEIVNRLDGLPLAIELAAARLRTMSVQDVADRLDDRFRLLTGGSRVALPRHRTLRAVVDWSWDLLEASERELAERLAVFGGGITAVSAAGVCAITPELASDLLDALLDKSLLHPIQQGRRFRMLETIREYGADRLAERGELEAARRRHAMYFTELAARAEPHLITAGQVPWFDVLHAERDNIGAALHLQCALGDADAALRLAVSMTTYSMMVGDNVQLAAWLSEALTVPGSTDESLRTVARATHALNTTGALGPTASVDTSAHGLLSLIKELDDTGLPPNSIASMMRPALAFLGGDEQLAWRYVEETLSSGNVWSCAAVRLFAAQLCENSGDLAGLRDHTARAMEAFRSLGERWGLSGSLRLDASLRVLDGDLSGAMAGYEEALGLIGELRSIDDVGFTLGRLADLALRSGDTAGARRYVERARQYVNRSSVGFEGVFVLALMSEVELKAGETVRARALLAEAVARLAELPPHHVMIGHVESVLGTARVRLALADGDLAGADAAATAAYQAAVGSRDLPMAALVGGVVAELTAQCGDPLLAASMLGAATRLRGADDPTSNWLADLYARLRTELGDTEFERAYAAGAAMARDDALVHLDPQARRR